MQDFLNIIFIISLQGWISLRFKAGQKPIYAFCPAFNHKSFSKLRCISQKRCGTQISTHKKSTSNNESFLNNSILTEEFFLDKTYKSLILNISSNCISCKLILTEKLFTPLPSVIRNKSKFGHLLIFLKLIFLVSK